MQDITTIILTYNEEIHIARCIENARKYAKAIFVLDSFSTDHTVEIASNMGAEVVQHEFVNQSQQLNWGLRNLPIQTQWVWRQDADEYLSDELIMEIERTLPSLHPDVNALTAPCLRIFMGRYIKHGILPLVLLRLFKLQYGSVENRMMDEHIQISEGIIGSLKNPFYDDNLNGLTWWTEKHNRYSDREAIELLVMELGLNDHDVVNSGEHSASIRKKKLRYARLPYFVRAFGFFFLRYVVKGGFLDGKEGFLWHFLQGFWYRALADAKAFEIKKKLRFDESKIKEFLSERMMKP